MADEENKGGAKEEGKGEEGKAAGAKDDEDDKEPGCCYKFGLCILSCLKGVYFFFKAIFMFIANCIGICWYPFKERTTDCCDCCGKRMNPHTDPAYGGF